MEFYVLRIVNSSISEYSEFEPVGEIVRVQPPSCKECGLRLGPMQRVPPLRYRMCGTQIGDLVNDSGVFAVSERFKTEFKFSALRGLTFSKAIELSSVTANYYLATPAYTYTLVNLDASGAAVEMVKECKTCKKALRNGLKRIRVNEETWGGDDVFFVANLSGLILTTNVFRQFVRDKGFTNFDLVHQDEYVEDTISR